MSSIVLDVRMCFLSGSRHRAAQCEPVRPTMLTIGPEMSERLMSAVHSRYPLSGITVIDLSHVYNGPYATFLMALAGADVIKVEPFQGEHLRSRGDMGGAALSFAMLNSNKKPVTLNLKTEKGRELLKELVARADILVENFAPGVMDRLGVGAADLQKINPRLIYGSSSGYGKNGPYRDYPAMDLVMQAMCGVIDSTGYPDQPPVKSGRPCAISWPASTSTARS